MTQYCKRCKAEINVPEFTEELKLDIWGLRHSPLSAIIKIEAYSGLNHEEAKTLLQHVNKEYGKCVRCDNANLSGENVECPKCKAFNLNWMINLSFTRSFCVDLEWRLSFESLVKLGRNDLRGFWCDGVSPEPSDTVQLSRKNVNDKRRIETKAWIGKFGHGEGEYEMKIMLGKYALRRYAKGASLIDCIPETDPPDWITINTDDQTIEIRLK